jgi:hypothetical protein
MYSVIIVSEKSSLLLREYKSLFAPFIANEQICFCNWNESGTDIKTSVPELYEKIKGKVSWRAVIINNPDSSINDEKLKYDHKNPFDFDCNRQETLQIRESEVPLIRLTQMLGGIPALPIDFEEKIVERKKKTDKILYIEKPFDDSESKANFDMLTKQYAFNECRPTEILLFTTKIKTEENIKAKITNVWKNNLEINSSDFWKRNGYPNICRFLTFETSKTENHLYIRELFQFWITVLTIATNKINSNTLQAYRLYEASVELSANELRNDLNEFYNRLCDARNNLVDILKYRTQNILPINELPIKRETVPVVFEGLNSDKLFANFSGLGLSKDCHINEEILWNTQICNMGYELSLFLKAPIRAIDMASDYANTKAIVNDKGVYDLDKYQMADMKDILDDYEEELLDIDTKDIIDIKKAREKMSIADKNVKRKIKLRMTKGVTIFSGIVALLVYFGGFIPFIIGNSEKLAMATFIPIIATLSLAIGGIITLFILRNKLKSEMENFNKIMRQIVDAVQNSAHKFEVCLSIICTYMQGQFILQKMQHNENSDIPGSQKIKRHIFVLSQVIQVVSRWSSSFGIKIERDKLSKYDGFFNYEVPPEENAAYNLYINKKMLNIPINSTGDKVTAPYDFVEKLKIEREEIYE